MTKRLAEDVSIVVITHNRPNFVNTFVKSLHILGFGGHLIIAESSSDELYATTQDALGKADVPFKVSHLHIRKSPQITVSQSMNECFVKGIGSIDTEYALMTCDDDIPVPRTLERFQKFLSKHNTFNGVTGEYVWFDTTFVPTKRAPNVLRKMFKTIWRNDNLQGRRRGLNPSNGLYSRTAKGRLDEFFASQFHTMFTLVRSNTLQWVVPPDQKDITFPHFAADFHWILSIAILGRIKHFKTPYIVRQFHGDNLSIKNENHLFPSYTDAMLTDNWGKDSRLFTQNLANRVAMVDGSNHKDAYAVALRAYQQLSEFRIAGDRQKGKKVKWPIRRIRKLSSIPTLLKYRCTAFPHCNIYTNAVEAIKESQLKGDIR